MGYLSRQASQLPFYYGWTVAAAASLVLFTTYGVQYSVGILLAAVEEDLGWGRAQVSLAFSIYIITYTTVSMLTGRLTDRWGPQWVVLVGGILLGAGLALLSLAQAPWHLYLSYSLLGGLGMSVAYVPCNTTVVRWFVARRGLALSITNLGSSLGIFLIPLILGAVVAVWGWRPAYVGAGIVVFFVVFLASRFLLRDPESAGLAGPAPEPRPGDRVEVVSLSLGQAVRTRNFWVFAAAVISVMSVDLIPFTHLPALVTLDRGGSAAQGALAASLIGAGAIPGVILTGPLSDRIGLRASAVLVASAAAVAYLGWILAPEVVPLFSFIFGMSYGGTIVLVTAMAGDFFGQAHVGAVFGLVFAGVGWVGSVGVVGAGIARESWGSYDLVFQLAFLMCLLSVGLFILLEMPQRR